MILHPTVLMGFSVLCVSVLCVCGVAVAGVVRCAHLERRPVPRPLLLRDGLTGTPYTTLLPSHILDVFIVRLRCTYGQLGKSTAL